MTAAATQTAEAVAPAEQRGANHGADALLHRLRQACTVDGYTSWPAYADALEDAVRALRSRIDRGCACTPHRF